MTKQVISSKVQDTLEHLKSMVDGGTSEFEKITAQKHIDRLCELHGISQDDFFVERELKWFRYHSVHEKKIVHGIIFKVMNLPRIMFYRNKRIRCHGVLVTPVEEIRINEMIEHYTKEWNDQLRKFTRAFIHTNDLYADTPEDGSIPQRSFTDSEVQELREIFALAKNITSTTPTKEVTYVE